MSEGPELRRSLGLFACTMMGVGGILGAGIYTLVGKAAALAGNAVWASFLASAIFAGLTGLGYAELASFIPRAGGQFHYVRRAFGDGVAFLTTWLLLVGLAAVSGTVALGFGGYLAALLPVSVIPAALVSILGTAAVLAYGIRESAWFAGIGTVAEVVGLLIVIAIGLPHVTSTDLLLAPHGLVGIGSGAALIFFAYIGFEEIVQLAEETKNPTRTLPRALLYSIVISTVLYVLVAVAAVSLIGWEELAASEAPLAAVAAKMGPRLSLTIAVIALFSTANTVLMMMLSAARLLFGMAEHGAMPPVLARVHPTWRTPWVATLVVSAVAAACVVGMRRIELVASVSNVALFITFILVNGAVIVLRFREPDTPRPFRVPGTVGRVPLIPVLGISGAIVLISQISLTAVAVAAGVALVGLVLRLVLGPRRAD